MEGVGGFGVPSPRGPAPLSTSLGPEVAWGGGVGGASFLGGWKCRVGGCLWDPRRG